VPLAGDPVSAASLDRAIEGFEAAHRRLYGFVAEGEPIQIVTLRIQATGQVPKATIPRRADAGSDAAAAILGERRVWLPEAGGYVTCPVYDRARLDCGNRLTGPAILEQMDATTLVLPGMQAWVEPHLSVVLEVS
jgi:N-methylhydantoinase A